MAHSLSLPTLARKLFKDRKTNEALHSLRAEIDRINGRLTLQERADLGRQGQPAQEHTSTARPVEYVRRKSVDLIAYYQFGVFAFEDDQLYDLLEDHQKRQDLRRYLSPTNEVDFDFAGKDDWLTKWVDHHTSAGVPHVIIDIGGHWGLFSLDCAARLAWKKTKAPIVCFEPGETARLIKATVELNKLQDIIEVQNLAVSDYSGPALFYEAEGYSNSNAILRHAHHEYASLAWCIDIRNVIERWSGYKTFLIKIDTEGHEETIMRAIESYFSSLDITFCIEVAYGPPRQKIINFLQSSTHVLHDFSSRAEVNHNGVPEFVDTLFDRPAHYCDLLCLPRRSAFLVETR